MKLKYAAFLLIPFSAHAVNNSSSSVDTLKILAQKFILTAQLCALESTYKDLESIMLTAQAKKTIKENRAELKKICDKKNKILKKIQAVQEQLIKDGNTEEEVEEMLLVAQQN